MPGYYADNAYNRRIGRAGLPKGSMPVSREGVFLPPRTYTNNSTTRLDREQFARISGLLNSFRSSDSDSGFSSSFSSPFSSPHQNTSRSDGGTSFSSPRQNTSRSDGGTSFSSPRQNTSYDSGIGSSFSSPFNSPQKTPDRNDVSWFDEYNKWTKLKITVEEEKIASKHEQQWQVMNLTDAMWMRELQQLQLEERENWTKFKMKIEKEKEDIYRRNQHEDLHRKKKKFSLTLVKLQQEEIEKWTMWQSKVEYEAEERKKSQKHACEINTSASEFQQFCQRPTDEIWTRWRNSTDLDTTDNKGPYSYQDDTVPGIRTNVNPQRPADETWTGWRNTPDLDTTDEIPNNQGPYSFCYQENVVSGTTTNVNVQAPTDEMWTRWRNPTDLDTTNVMPINQVPYSYQNNTVPRTMTNTNPQESVDTIWTKWRTNDETCDTTIVKEVEQKSENDVWTRWQNTTDLEKTEQDHQSFCNQQTLPGKMTNLNLQGQCENQALLGQMTETTLMSQHHESASGFQNTTNIGSEYQETMRFIHTGIENFNLQTNIEDDNAVNTINKSTIGSSPHSDFTDDDYIQSWKPSTSYQVSSSNYMADKNRPKPVQKKKSGTTNNDASSSYLKSRRKSNDHGKQIRFSHPDHSLKLHTSAINEGQFKNSRPKALNDRKDKTKPQPKKESYTMKGYTGKVVDFENIEMIRTLSVQGFCKKHIARWNDTIVVTKMIDVRKVSERTTTKFQNEILLSSAIEHSNIVKYLGASIVHPNLCILTEFMQTNLYEALHIEENIKFLEWEKVKLIQQVASGLEYLHKKDMTHCSLETRNVLLHYTPGSSLVAKLSDFSHGVKILNETEEKYMRSEQNSRYSAPEILCEEYVNMKFLKMADVYSFSLIIFEVIFEQEPFQTLDISEVAKQIRESGLTPAIPRNVSVNKTLLSFIVSGWDRNPTQRPTIRHFANYSLGMDHIYTKANSQDKDITIYFYLFLCFIGFLCLDEFIFDIMSTCSIVMLFMFVLSCIILFKSNSVKLMNTR
ncbi:unnamed protein product [Mytilus coruscus]|uniref:Protein kinase domain-containing protein n=1 Tax=Mytilus coruscus TaxID=42192 RepID=A0A6J8DWK8_MYTCO|nr:unnamed protein product [Mytilus coruscus]